MADDEVMADKKRGDAESFIRNWSTRREVRYNHWVKGRPSNQIQLAFRQHWRLFREILGNAGGGTCLEIGCGRGSISSYFADNGFECVLLDISPAALQVAEAIFANNGHRASFIAGDANRLAFPDAKFDVVVSIGLLEHFEDIGPPIAEQIRVLKSDGMFLGYIVPERPDNIQRYFRWVNVLLDLAGQLVRRKGGETQKTPIFRSDLASPRYVDVLAGLPVHEIRTMGVYPLPMISHSPEFPFSLLPKPLEWMLTRAFEAVLYARKLIYRKNPWICDEDTGQAFLVTCRKR